MSKLVETTVNNRFSRHYTICSDKESDVFSRGKTYLLIYKSSLKNQKTHDRIFGFTDIQES